MLPGRAGWRGAGPGRRRGGRGRGAGAAGRASALSVAAAAAAAQGRAGMGRRAAAPCAEPTKRLAPPSVGPRLKRPSALRGADLGAVSAMLAEYPAKTPVCERVTQKAI